MGVSERLLGSDRWSGEKIFEIMGPLLTKHMMRMS